MHVTAQQLFRDLEAGASKPFYLVVGDEPFQAGEILSRLKAHFLRNETENSFNFETWDGDHLDAHALLSSLETLPGLFSSGEDSVRLILCRNFDKASVSALDTLQRYFENPSPTTCFVMLATKADKRKSWYKQVDEKGGVIEVSEPYDREWPKWQGYFERKIGKSIDPEAWERLVQCSGRTLSILWVELEKLSIYVGNSPKISTKDITSLSSTNLGGDIFGFAEDVLNRKPYTALQKFQELLKNGESEIKILSIVVRQFRLVEQYLKLSKKGVADNKVLGAQLGIHPFFVSKVAQQAKHHNLNELKTILCDLADCDYQLKTGENSFFPKFLVPYFGQH